MDFILFLNLTVAFLNKELQTVVKDKVPELLLVRESSLKTN